MSGPVGEVRLVVDGAVTTAPAGAPIAAVLGLRRALRLSPRKQGPRTLFCGIGACFECLVIIDGAPARACLARARDGMVVETARCPRV